MYILKIDEDLINYEIAKYQAMNNKNPNYIILNEDTLKVLEQNITLMMNANFNLNKEPKHITRYRGINMATCNALKFGEVDIK